MHYDKFLGCFSRTRCNLERCELRVRYATAFLNFCKMMVRYSDRAESEVAPLSRVG